MPKITWIPLLHSFVQILLVQRLHTMICSFIFHFFLKEENKRNNYALVYEHNENNEAFVCNRKYTTFRTKANLIQLVRNLGSNSWKYWSCNLCVLTLACRAKISWQITAWQPRNRKVKQKTLGQRGPCFNFSGHLTKWIIFHHFH